MRVKSNYKEILLSSISIIIGIVFSLVVAEIALRVSNFGFGYSPLIGDKVLHHVHPPNYHFVTYNPWNEWGSFDVHYDEHGHRVCEKAAPAADNAVLALGDSFVEANQVPCALSFVGRLAAAFPNRAVYNLGVSSYSPVLERLVLSRELNRLKDKTGITVIQLLYANDFDDDERYARLAVRDASGEITAAPGEPVNQLAAFSRNFFIVRLLRMAQEVVRRRWFASDDAAKMDGGNPGRVGIGRETVEALDQTIALVRRFNAHYYLMCVPPKARYLQRKETNEDRFCEEVRRYAAAAGVVYVDLVKAFDAAALKPGGVEPFFARDIHFNPEGHRLVYEALTPLLQAEASRRGLDRFTDESAYR